MKGKSKSGKNEKYPEDKFDWGLYPELEVFVNGLVDNFLQHNAFSKKLSQRMLNETSTKFIDWIDHIRVPDKMLKESKLKGLGLREVRTKDILEGDRAFKHMQSYLFPILTTESSETEVALKPELIDHFIQMLGTGAEIEGEPFSIFRKAIVSNENGYCLSAVERRGYGGFILKEQDDISEYVKLLSKFFTRRRNFTTDEEGMRETEKLIQSSVKKIRSERVSDAFFRGERQYWQNRNRAGQVQKARQDRLGLGWGNHDHHTYRSSRANFAAMIRIFEQMGYTCREKYYAGEQAGWGAQILEHQICNIVVFTDVDLWPEETKIDFAHKGLPERARLGTVGLWIGLHGESILQAGMHHLEARFDFNRLSNDLSKQGVQVMKPFSNFDFLKQAFTVGDIWPVEKKRLDKLLSRSYITKEQYEKFRIEGAIGSHMENLQRDQGFKGFNKASVTKIINATDPRIQHYGGA